MRIRAGDDHRFIVVWVVVVEGRAFVRPWNDKRSGWYRAFLEEPRGSIEVNEREVAVRAKPAKGERLNDAVDAAYAAKYTTKPNRKYVNGFATAKRRATTMELLPRQAWSKARRVGSALGLLGLLTISAPTPLVAQRATLWGVILAHESKEPLAYSIVALPALGRESFTTDSGAFVFGELPVGPLLLKVRRLGYTPADITINVTAGMDTVRIELSRIAVRLGAVIVRAYPPCTNPGVPAAKDTTLATVFSQLHMNADQYRVLSDQYPFISATEVTMSHKAIRAGITSDSKALVAVDSRRQWQYRPGSVVTLLRGGYWFNIPTIVHFADVRFIAEHCFYYAGLDTINEFPVVRIDFDAAEHIKAPYVSGSLYLDPESFEIRRSVLRLTQMPRVRAMTGLEVTTDFDELMESIPVISHVTSVQSFDTTARRSLDAAYEEHKLLGVQWAGRKPGQEKKSP